MNLNFLRKWFDAVITFFTERRGVFYIHPLSAPHDFDSDHEVALVMNRQREAFLKMRAAGKSCLDAYTRPETFVGDRIDVYFKKEGVTPPTELKRKPRALEVRIGQQRPRTAR